MENGVLILPDIRLLSKSAVTFTLRSKFDNIIILSGSKMTHEGSLS
jgi:hypothetical protein